MRISPTFALTALFLGLASGASAQSYEARIRLSTDLQDPALGVPIKVEQAGTTWNVSTDGQGRTPYIDVGPSSVLDLTFRDTAVPGGQLLGQRFTESTSASITGADRFDEFWYTQPLALTTYVDSSEPAYARGLHLRWAIERVAQGASYAFTAKIGQVALQREVDGYFDYFGIGPAPNDSTALVIRYGDKENPVNLSGAFLHLDVAALPVSSLPDVTTYLIARTTADLGSSSLTGYFAGMQDGYALIGLDGSLGYGDNVILLSGSSGASNGPIATLAQASAVPVPQPAAGSTTSSSGGCDDCDQTACVGTAPNFICNWGPPRRVTTDAPARSGSQACANRVPPR